MGRGPTRHPPRHLAAATRSRTDAGEHLVAEWLLAAVAIVLTAAVLISSMFDRPDRPDPGPAAGAAPPAAPATTGPAATGPPGTAPPVAGLAAWRAIGGTRVERTAVAPDRPAAAGFAGTGRADQGMTLAAVHRCARGAVYAATVRLRASRPYVLVEVTLLELSGGRRFAADTVGAVLLDRSWLRVQVTHQAHRLGSALALEVVLPRGSAPATVQVDDLQVVAHRP
jgi:hypothetical protein